MCCDLHLAQVSNMLSATIKVGTIKLYLTVAVSISLNHKQLDPLLNDCSQDVQKIKKRTVQVQMIKMNAKPQRTLHYQNCIAHGQKCDGNYPYKLDSVMCDWSAICIFCGCFLCEWTQNASDKKQHLASADVPSLALILPDLTFLRVNRNAIPQSWSSELHNSSVKLVQLQ